MMKIFPIIFFACLAVCSPVVKNKRNKAKFNLNAYCDALPHANVLFNSTDHIPGQDPMKNCRKKCNVGRLSVMWFPNSLETKLVEQHLHDIIMYYNLKKLQSWLAGQIRFKGCLAPGKSFISKNCKMSCYETQSAEAQITSLLKHFPYHQNEKNQFKKMRKRALKAFKNDKDARRMVKKTFRKKSFRSAENLAKRTSSCLLHTSHVTEKLTAFCG